MYFLSNQFSAMSATADTVLYPVWPWNEDMNEMRVRERVVKNQNNTVPEIRLKSQCFRHIYAVIAIEHVCFVH